MGTPINLDRSTGLVTEGMHLFKIVSAEDGASKESGQPMWIIGMECQDGEEDKGKKFTLWLSMVPAARFKVDDFLDAIEAPAHGELTPEQTVGKLLKVYITHGDYNGRKSMNAFRMFSSSFNGTVTPPTPKSGSVTPKTPELEQNTRRPSF
jgi:hypothetical protein